MKYANKNAISLHDRNLSGEAREISSHRFKAQRNSTRGEPWGLHSASLGSPGGAGGEYTLKLVEGSVCQETVRGQSTAMRGLLKPALYPEVKVWGGTNLTAEDRVQAIPPPTRAVRTYFN